MNINAGSGGHDMISLSSVGGDYQRQSPAFPGSRSRRFRSVAISTAHLFESNPGAIGAIMIGGSLTALGVLEIFDAADPKVLPAPTGLLGDIGTMTVGGSIAGLVQVSGNMTTLYVGPADSPTANGMNDVSGQVIVGGAITNVSVSGDVPGPDPVGVHRQQSVYIEAGR